MTHNLVRSNLKYILLYSDMLASRLLLTVGSTLWIIWCVGAQFHPEFLQFAEEYTTPIVVYFGILFTAHAITSYLSLLWYNENKWLSLFATSTGAIAWTGSTIIIMVTRIVENTVPMGGAHWAMLIMAWWIFFRDCALHRQ